MVLILLRQAGALFSRRSRGWTAVLAVVVVLFAATGCHHAVTDPNDRQFIVAEAPNWHITRGELDDQVLMLLKENHKTPAEIGPAKMPMLQTEVLKTMVLKKLLLARAAALPLKDVDQDEAKTMEQFKGQFPSEAEMNAQLKLHDMTLDDVKKRIHEDVLIHKTLEAEAFQNLTPTDAEINAFYLQNRSKFAIPQKIRASRVVIMIDPKMTSAEKAAKKKQIDAAHARVLKGEDFSKVATAVSEDRYSAPKGGDVGYFQKGENEAQFDEVAFATKPGSVSAVFETPMGYEFLKVTDVHPGGDVSIAEARDTISKYLLQLKQRAAVEAYTKKILADGGATFHFVMVEPPATPAVAPGGAAAGTPQVAPSDDATASPAADQPASSGSGQPAPQ